MLSYQHGFHAGNKADVLKHAVLDTLLRHIADAGKPALHVETHAGRARYDLAGEQASKTGEAADGVVALLETGTPRPLRPWARLVEDQTLNAYPGSPALARLRLGDAGRLILFEKHPAEHAALCAAFDGDRGVQIKKADGYSGALKLQPRRGETMIVFSDPSYETIKDMDELAEWTPRALARWPDAMVVLWLPLFKDEREAEFGAYLAELEDGVVAGARWPAPDDRDTALSGSAIVAYRVPKPVREAATSIASTLNSVWSL
ncbi:MAG: 23S rRNA (adenine(2030)-N(6))-methyltransferase RlmJ [Pseudomonadota bacterium]